MKIKYVILFFLCLQGCSTTLKIPNKTLIGKYVWEGFFELGANFELKSDSTFVYQLQEGLAMFNSSGTWTVKNKYLIFNSFLQQKDFMVKFNLLNKAIINNDSITFHVINENDESLPLIWIRLFKDSKLVIDTADKSVKEKLTVRKIEFDSVCLAYVGYNNIEYKNTDNSDYFKFKMIPVNDDYRVFTNKRFIIKKKSNSRS